jgi:hypothetical protein
MTKVNRECCDRCFKWEKHYGEYIHPCNNPNCNCHTGVVTWDKDENGQLASVTYKAPINPLSEKCEHCDGTGWVYGGETKCAGCNNTRLKEFYKTARDTTFDEVDGLLRRELATMADKAHFSTDALDEIIYHISRWHIDRLSQTRNDLLRELKEEMPKKDNYDNDEFPTYNNGSKDGFNNAIDQVNTLLESKLSTVKKI